MRLSAPIGRQAMAFILAGGRGSRLMELTDRRAKPAVYFGGKSRIIDFTLSNALNSGIRHIGVATQYKAHSLIGHLNRGWNFFRQGANESFDILPASQRVSETQWYAGTADAVYQNIDIIRDRALKYMVILAGDHIYKMDYELMLQEHVEPISVCRPILNEVSESAKQRAPSWASCRSFRFSNLAQNIWSAVQGFLEAESANRLFFDSAANAGFFVGFARSRLCWFKALNGAGFRNDPALALFGGDQQKLKRSGLRCGRAPYWIDTGETFRIARLPNWLPPEPRRVCRRPFVLRHAAIAGSSSCA